MRLTTRSTPVAGRPSGGARPRDAAPGMVVLGGVLLAALPHPTQAQCSWSGPSTGPAGPVVAMVAWDPDGPGPLPESLVVGGTFSFAAGQAANNVAIWNGAQWATLGQGLGGEVRTLAVYQGQLLAGGRFTTSGTTPVPYLARWTGSGGLLSGSSPMAMCLRCSSKGST